MLNVCYMYLLQNNNNKCYILIRLQTLSYLAAYRYKDLSELWNSTQTYILIRIQQNKDKC